MHLYALIYMHAMAYRGIGIRCRRLAHIYSSIIKTMQISAARRMAQCKGWDWYENSHDGDGERIAHADKGTRAKDIRKSVSESQKYRFRGVPALPEGVLYGARGLSGCSGRY